MICLLVVVSVFDKYKWPRSYISHFRRGLYYGLCSVYVRTTGRGSSDEGQPHLLAGTRSRQQVGTRPCQRQRRLEIKYDDLFAAGLHKAQPATALYRNQIRLAGRCRRHWILYRACHQKTRISPLDWWDKALIVLWKKKIPWDVFICMINKSRIILTSDRLGLPSITHSHNSPDTLSIQTLGILFGWVFIAIEQPHGPHSTAIQRGAQSVHSHIHN